MYENIVLNNINNSFLSSICINMRQ